MAFAGDKKYLTLSDQGLNQLVESASGSVESCVSTTKQRIRRATAEAASRQWGTALRAVVLTGSLARDEATFVDKGHQRTLLGDADFFLIFHGDSPLPSKPEIVSIKKQIEDVLREHGIIASLSLSPARASYLRGLPRQISTYEMRTCGEVVWGEENILSCIPEFSPQQILLEDAWRMIGNRMIELLEATSSVMRSKDVWWQGIHYSTVKLYLDMATSYLAFTGHYQPTYRLREKALRELAESGSAEPFAPFPLLPFAERVNQCTNFKLTGSAAGLRAENLWEEDVGYCSLLWRWELRRLSGKTAELSDPNLMIKWMECQPAGARMRGWASILQKSGWRSWRHWPRWFRLSLVASPRYWVYCVASEVFFRLPALLSNGSELAANEVNWKRLRNRLPLTDELSVSDDTEWERLARLVAQNYHVFLETTTA